MAGAGNIDQNKDSFEKDDEIKSMDTEKIKKHLFQIAMKSEWSEVVRTYRLNQKAHKAKITRTGDTALHIAVSDQQEDHVEELVGLISNAMLEMKNERGNTPLHLAASMGNVRMCACIAKHNTSLVGVPNDDNETPLFLAALHGKKDAFLCLHNIYINDGKQIRYNYCRRKDGDTILHCAIFGDYFDLAFQIISLYGDLANSVNEQGVSPLHLLAAKPSAFKSGSHLSLTERIIYHCIYVDKLRVERPDDSLKQGIIKTFEEEKDPKYPENYQTCMNFIRLFWSLIRVVIVKLNCPKADPGTHVEPARNMDVTENSYAHAMEINDEESVDVSNSMGIDIGNMDGTENSSANAMEINDEEFVDVSNSMGNMDVTENSSANAIEVNDEESVDVSNSMGIDTVIVKPNCQKADPKTPVEPDSRIHQSFDSFPANYRICFEYVKLLSKSMLIVLGLGFTEIRKIREKKKKHKWSVQIMNELLKRTSMYEYEYSGMNPEPLKDKEETLPYDIVDGNVIMGSESIDHELPKDADIKGTKTDKQKMGEGSSGETTEKKTDKLLANLKKEISTLIAAKSGVTEMVEMILDLFPVAINAKNTEKKNIWHFYVPVIEATQKKTPKPKKETVILIAAKNGVTEMVEKILELFPVAIHDMNGEKKNIVLLAAENRRPHLYQFLLKRKILKESVFRKVDDQGNSALHLAAKLEEDKPWLIDGAALQMQWEMKWYEFLKESMTPHFSAQTNMLGQTAHDIFTETHTEIIKAGGKWLTNTSQSCSVVAALIATVAFATSSTVPGGIKQENGTPTLVNQPAFDLFAIASLVALCFSVTAMVMFLSILTSRHEEKDFGRDLPRKLLAGMTSLFMSIGSILVSFCAGHFFVLRDKLKYAAFPVYAITCLPVTFFAVAHLPLYVDLVWATFKKIPRRRFKIAPV